MTSLRTLVAFGRAAAARWSRGEILARGAALAYYAIFALAPLLVLLIAAAGFVVGRETVQAEILRQVAHHVTADAAAMIEDMLARFASRRSGLVATIVGVLSMLVGATGVFGHVQTTLDHVWDVPRGRRGGLRGLLRKRLVSFLLVLTLGALLLATMLLSTVLAAGMERVERFAPALVPLLGRTNFAVSFALTSAAFALAFRVLPSAHVEWRDVWLGGVVAALLFTLGKTLLGLYLGRAGVASVYGAAGSLVVLLLWIYYSAQIFFAGAVVSAEYACWWGSRRPPVSVDASPR